MSRAELIKKFSDYVYYFKAYCTSDAEDHEMLKAVLALLKEQDNCENCAIAIDDRQPVVRCKDCEHCYFASNRVPMEQSHACGKHGIDVTPDWFCADGERKEGR